MTLSTLADLNALSSSHACLALLRALNTSDFTFMYQLLDASTLRDIARMCDDLLKLDTPAADNADDVHPLTPAEIVEYNSYLRALLENIE